MVARVWVFPVCIGYLFIAGFRQFIPPDSLWAGSARVCAPMVFEGTTMGTAVCRGECSRQGPESGRKLFQV